MFALTLLLSLMSFANENKTPLSLIYSVTTTENGVTNKKVLQETISILRNNSIWIELKADKYFVSYAQGEFFFFNLVSGTRHPIKLRKNSKLVLNTASVPTCAQQVSVIDPQSTNKETFTLCLGEKAPNIIPSHVFLWLTDPTFMDPPKFENSIYNFVPTQAKSSNNLKIETKRVLIKQTTEPTFKDDGAQLWKLPLGKPCSSRYCGQLL